MREYELVIVAQADLDEAAFAELLSRISGWITDGGGEVTKTDVWGKRRLAYVIRKQKEAQYALLHTKMAPSFGIELERNLRFQETILRFLLVAK